MDLLISHLTRSKEDKPNQVGWGNSFKNTNSDATSSGVNRVIMRGQLLKQGQSKSSWRRRWVVVMHDRIDYYKRENSSKVQGSIPLIDCLSVNSVELDNLNRPDELQHMFQITVRVLSKEAPLKYTFCAPNDADKRDWVTCIYNVVQDLKNRNLHNSPPPLQNSRTGSIVSPPLKVSTNLNLYHESSPSGHTPEIALELGELETSQKTSKELAAGEDLKDENEESSTSSKLIDHDAEKCNLRRKKWNDVGFNRSLIQYREWINSLGIWQPIHDITKDLKSGLLLCKLVSKVGKISGRQYLLGVNRKPCTRASAIRNIDLAILKLRHDENLQSCYLPRAQDIYAGNPRKIKKLLSGIFSKCVMKKVLSDRKVMLTWYDSILSLYGHRLSLNVHEEISLRTKNSTLMDQFKDGAAFMYILKHFRKKLIAAKDEFINASNFYVSPTKNLPEASKMKNIENIFAKLSELGIPVVTSPSNFILHPDPDFFLLQLHHIWMHFREQQPTKDDNAVRIDSESSYRKYPPLGSTSYRRGTYFGSFDGAKERHEGSCKTEKISSEKLNKPQWNISTKMQSIKRRNSLVDLDGSLRGRESSSSNVKTGDKGILTYIEAERHTRLNLKLKQLSDMMAETQEVQECSSSGARYPNDSAVLEKLENLVKGEDVETESQTGPAAFAKYVKGVLQCLKLGEKVTLYGQPITVLEDIFSAVDKDKNGAITLVEITDLCSHLKFRLSEEEIIDLMMFFDKGDMGYVDRKDFMKSIKEIILISDEIIYQTLDLSNKAKSVDNNYGPHVHTTLDAKRLDHAHTDSIHSNEAVSLVDERKAMLRWLAVPRDMEICDEVGFCRPISSVQVISRHRRSFQENVQDLTLQWRHNGSILKEIILTDIMQIKPSETKIEKRSFTITYKSGESLEMLEILAKDSDEAYWFCVALNRLLVGPQKPQI